MKVYASLSLFFDYEFAQLPSEKKALVLRHYALVPWDELSVEQRRVHASHQDYLNPIGLVEEQATSDAFHRGFRRVMAANRNKRNAARARPSRQAIPDDVIVAMRAQLEAEQVLSHKQCARALELLKAQGWRVITIQGFRKRWTKLRLAAKKET